MNPRTRAWALLGVASCMLACGNETPAASANAGTAGVATAGTNAGMSGGGTSGGSATTIAGSAGSTSAGSASGGASAGAGGATGGSVNGGASGAAGSSGAGGAGGAGSSTLPKRVLLYHFSTLVIASVPAQISLLKTQLMTWGYEVEDSVNPDDLSTSNLARFGGVGMINTCFEPFGTGKTGEAQTAAL